MQNKQSNLLSSNQNQAFYQIYNPYIFAGSIYLHPNEYPFNLELHRCEDLIDNSLVSRYFNTTMVSNTSLTIAIGVFFAFFVAKCITRFTQVLCEHCKRKQIGQIETIRSCYIHCIDKDHCRETAILSKSKCSKMNGFKCKDICGLELSKYVR